MNGVEGYHLSRSFGEDPFAPECGCEKAPCGMAVARNECHQHGGRESIRGGHLIESCPGAA